MSARISLNNRSVSALPQLRQPQRLSICQSSYQPLPTQSPTTHLRVPAIQATNPYQNCPPCCSSASPPPMTDRCHISFCPVFSIPFFPSAFVVFQGLASRYYVLSTMALLLPTSMPSRYVIVDLICWCILTFHQFGLWTSTEEATLFLFRHSVIKRPWHHMMCNGVAIQLAASRR